MKTALLIPGLIRPGYKKCFESINKYFIQPYNPDIFMSIWDSIYVEDVLRLYNPIYCRVEDYDDQSTKMRINNFLYFLDSINFSKKERLIESSYPMFYKLYDTNVLKKDYETIKNFKYDLVIRMRFDLNFDKISETFDDSIPKFFGIDPIEMKDVLINDILYLRKDKFCRMGRPDDFDEWIFDHFAFGNNEVMDDYCNVLLNLEKMISSGEDNLNVNELLLLRHLRENNIFLKQTKTVYEVNRDTK